MNSHHRVEDHWSSKNTQFMASSLANPASKINSLLPAEAIQRPGNEPSATILALPLAPSASVKEPFLQLLRP